MSKKTQDKQIDQQEIMKLLKDPIIVRIVTVLDIANLSVLELFEYGLTREDVNHAIVSGVIELDQARLPKGELDTYAEGLHAIAGDVYFQQFLRSKARLTRLGLFLLDCIKSCQTEQDIIEKVMGRFGTGMFRPPEHPHKP
ncbi:hypothetical protein [Nitrososphaera viennensis]|uniref:Uncharacterized protein n=1 Tax=Nitrososphaera viennensis TaxID=1034015 RepID=A0A977NML6_9ARCH|nr:hypothetical protein [Nitrososphaera viennensis]UVS69572.1 hypothetical protein NWT39_02015 [Nitrososphaera viennensis]